MMNDYDRLNEEEKRRFNGALSVYNFSQQKINEIIRFAETYSQQKKASLLTLRPFHIGLIYAAYLALGFYLYYFQSSYFYDFVESIRSNNSPYLLHDTNPASWAIVGVAFLYIIFPLIAYILPIEAFRNWACKSKIVEFYTMALLEAKGKINKKPMYIAINRIDSTFNSLPLMVAFKYYLVKEERMNKLVLIPLFLLTLCFTSAMILKSHWVATKAGITFVSYAGFERETRPWADVIEVQTACYSTKRRKSSPDYYKYYPTYYVIFKDYTKIALLNTPQEPHIAERFDKLAIIDALLMAQNTPKIVSRWNDERLRIDSNCLEKVKHDFPMSYKKIYTILGVD